MNEATRRKIEELLKDPIQLIKKKPYVRGTIDKERNLYRNYAVQVNEMLEARLPMIRYNVVTTEELLAELDPQSHKVLYDQNIPSITMKTDKGGYVEIEYKKMAVPFQRLIKDKKVLRLCGNPMQFTLMDTEPTDKQLRDFVTFKQFWDLRNMSGMRTKMVDAQLSCGDSGLLFYFDKDGCIKARLLSYMNGYVLCPHNDDNGDRILESVYYQVDGVNYIDSYDDKYMYRYVQDWTDESSVMVGEWQMRPPIEHGFSEIPLITKRGKVAWDNVQNIIEVYEVMYNIFLVIQKRHGWGILYVKGSFKDNGRKIAGAIVLNDTSIEGNGSAEFKTPPTPEGMLKTLELMEETIQKGSGCTFILPKDISLSGDISGVAVKISQELDNENALLGAIEWQNVADKMCRLFKEGLAKELVNTGEKEWETAVTDFENLHINAKFKEWMPQSDTDYNSMLIQLKGAGLISEETGIERNTESSPDEKIRRKKEKEEAQAQAERNLMLSQNSNNNNNGSQKKEERGGE